MLSTLVDRFKTAVAFMQSVLDDDDRLSDQKRTRVGRPAVNRRVEREAMPRRAAEPGGRRSDFQGEAPSALVSAYREAVEADQDDQLRRRSFVI